MISRPPTRLGAILPTRPVAAALLIALESAALACAALPSAQAKPGEAKSTKALPAGTNLAATAGATSTTIVDVRTGKLLWSAQQRALQAETGTGPVGGVATLTGVTGIFYQNGKAADRVTAPTVVGRPQNKAVTVTATGGVRVVSLTQADTSVRCDQLVWHSDTNKMLGTGDVVVKSRGVTQRGPSFLADTKLQSVLMPAPSSGAAARRTVHVVFPAAPRGNGGGKKR